MYYRSYDGWRHSPLNQISTANVGKLVPKWFMSLGELGKRASINNMCNLRLAGSGGG